ncbi:hypothetical protein J21TS7_24270 [Paenibacillus cineris]|uniref:Uncharacterized protein n=1 Tax=Paenibacillus cineris TaxID=237530 RepID=A0ABQ4LC09_9BACL|nr:hypothetical protein J21TS7_24270 [Paenibacillus cineris]
MQLLILQFLWRGRRLGNLYIFTFKKFICFLQVDFFVIYIDQQVSILYDFTNQLVSILGKR